jgi:hypothetical protein
MRIRPSCVLLGLVVACSGKVKATEPTGGTAGGPPPGPIASVMVAAKVSTVPMPMFASSSQLATDQQAPPWTLTATDGSGLLVTRVEAKAVLQGPLAFTELHLYFHNTEARVREGTFEITLPSGAAVSRFAMENDGQWMEAEVVGKQLARRAYEDALHRRQDPALLEKAAGNQFSARVFPIPAKADKHLVISFSQELPGERYVLPLRGLPKVERVDVRLDVTGAGGARTEQVLSERNWQPTRDFVSSAPTSVEALTSGTLVAAQLTAFDANATAKDAPAAITMLVDTSASRALGFERYTRSLRELISTLVSRYGDSLAIEVIAFDQDTQAIYAGRAAVFGDAQVKALLARGAAGASDLGQALASLGSPRERVVIVSDAVVTAGKSGADLAAAVKQLGAKKVARVDVVLAGGIRDDRVAASLVHAGLPHAGAVLDLDAGISDVASGLGEAVLVDVPVDVPGALWVYPRTIASARAGSRTMVYARLAKPAQTIEVSVAGKRRAIGLAGGTPALIERATATAEIAELETRLETTKPEAMVALEAEIAKKSVAARVVSSQTAMLVLESDADYARFGIDRTALADILVVGPRGIEQTHRKAQIAVAIARPPAKPTVSDQTQQKDGAKYKPMKEDLAAEPADKVAMVTEEEKPAFSGATEALEQKVIGDNAGPADRPPLEPATPRPPPARPRIADPSPATGASASAVDRHERSDMRSADARVRGQAIQQTNHPLAESSAGTGEAWPPRDAPRPLTGKLAEIEDALAAGNASGALTKARAWHDREPGDVLALIGLGDSLEATKDLTTAARIYGSIIDLFPGRADLRRFAGERLERIGANARTLAVDTYRHAVEERPDHITGHRLLAYALLRAGQHAEAFAAILAGLDQKYPDGRFAGGERVLTDDAGLIGAAYLASAPAKRAEIIAALAKRNAALPSGASTRFILYWETDANDVDFHIQDARGGHAFFGARQLASGGELYADITTGYGPECFAIPGTPKAGPYRLSINYYSQGPMGYGMGLLQIVKHDGKGGLSFQDRPYVIMADHAYVNLGSYP